jgi:hypothetical protein
MKTLALIFSWVPIVLAYSVTGPVGDSWIWIFNSLVLLAAFVFMVDVLLEAADDQSFYNIRTAYIDESFAAVEKGDEQAFLISSTSLLLFAQAVPDYHF